MSKRLDREGLFDLMDAEVGWRRQELSTLKTALERARGRAVDTASRTAIALAYAHWEGYVVTASRAFVDYVKQLQLGHAELADGYLAMCIAGRLVDAGHSIRRIQRHIDVVSVIRNSNEPAVFPTGDKLIHAEGNLKSEKFRDLVARLHLNAEPFELHYNWLDSELLRRRNHIAHGQAGHADPEFALEALTTVTALLDFFRTAVQNALVLEVYRRETAIES